MNISVVEKCLFTFQLNSKKCICVLIIRNYFQQNGLRLKLLNVSFPVALWISNIANHKIESKTQFVWNIFINTIERTQIDTKSTGFFFVFSFDCIGWHQFPLTQLKERLVSQANDKVIKKRMRSTQSRRNGWLISRNIHFVAFSCAPTCFFYSSQPFHFPSISCKTTWCLTMFFSLYFFFCDEW